MQRLMLTVKRGLLPGIIALSFFMPAAIGGIALAQDSTPEVTPVVTVTPAPTTPPIVVQQPTDLSQLLDRALNLILVLIIAYLAYRQGALTSPETLDKIFGFLRSVTSSTTSPDDDKLLGIIEEVVRRVAAEVKPVAPPTSTVNINTTDTATIPNTGVTINLPDNSVG